VQEHGGQIVVQRRIHRVGGAVEVGPVEDDAAADELPRSRRRPPRWARADARRDRRVDGQFSRKSLPRSCTIHHGKGGRRRQSSQRSFQLLSGRSDQYTRIVLAPHPSGPGSRRRRRGRRRHAVSVRRGPW
jgi:hypothetical protein